MALDKNVKAFVVHVKAFNLISIYLAQEARIALLIVEQVEILAKYSDFADVFLEEKASDLSEVTKLNQHTIKLQEGQQPPYMLI